MRAIEIGAPGGLDHLRIVEKPDPTPGAGEVLLRIRAVSLNARDVGMAGRATETTVSPFSDACAIVESVGDGVSRVKPGDRVSTIFYPKWLGGKLTAEKRSVTLGGAVGTGSELLVISEEAICKVPDFLSDHQVATLTCAGVTAWHALMVAANAAAGETVVLQGTGGVSIFALQFAKAAGLETVITSSSSEKLARAKDLGASHTINYRDHPEWSKEVRGLTNGRGADAVIEVGGAGTLQESLKSTAIGGTVAIVGVLTGAQEPLPIPTLMGNTLHLRGVTVGSREMFEDMCTAIQSHRIEPVVDQVFLFDDVRAAYDAMKSGDRFGKIVIDFSR
ncbi:MAG: NAD(P)-dependent alcohol dehydrogenase [Phenylobacterium sp.]|uniref:zinc-dependent alcohol dehydrogenase family protein n=1 Tax=Phenylobacterium sp. TaxID=1871053 RepID=UPI002736898F|nr:NAD(P)-dependent alcohol dehydrogenase [Phenylobacterium sp.]MDP3750006.1 NAD(P)-dependent alcohol dehydrogenase [Phenylobacterium sp.]